MAGINKVRWQQEPGVRTLVVNFLELVRLNVLLLVQPVIEWGLKHFGPTAGRLDGVRLFG